MTRPPAPQDLVLHLRTRCPRLARRLDGARGLARRGDDLRLRVPEESWSHGELVRHLGELEAEAGRLFGPGTRVTFEPTPRDAEAIPFPALASKVWNHLAFWARQGPRSVVLAVRKPLYLGRWLTEAERGTEAGLLERSPGAPDVRVFRYRAPDDLPAGEGPDDWILPDLLDDLCALAREGASYVHLLTAFPGDETAERLEARLAVTKEWGTPRTPSPLLHKYTGRLHYLPPEGEVLGLRLARRVLSQQG